MNEAIEDIWKAGFMNDDALVVPKVNHLYSQKSKMLVAKLERMFKVNLIAILVFSGAVLAGLVFLGMPYLGVVLCLLFVGLVGVGKKELDRLEKLDKGASSYDYLKAFDQWLKDVIAIYTKIYRVFYPVVFLAFVVGFWYSSVGGKVIHKFVTHYPNVDLIYGVPWVGIVGVGVVACVIGIMAGPIYKLDMQLVYGREFKKLEEILADMETLKR